MFSYLILKNKNGKVFPLKTVKVFDILIEEGLK